MRIAQVILGDAWGGISPEKLEKGIGGREGALIRLAREWARKGHQVTNYVPTQESQLFDEGGGYHEYVPAEVIRQTMRAFPYDAVIAWECPGLYADERVRKLQRVRLVEMQCAHFVSKSEQTNASRWATGVCALSPWHRDFMLYDGLRIDESRLHVLPNGVDLTLYPEMSREEIQAKRKSRKFFYSSSPDRGLAHVLKSWPLIRSVWPDAELHVAYGVHRLIDVNRWSHLKQAEMALDVEDGMKQPGVVDRGTVGQKELAEIQRSSAALLYPCDPIQPTETGCITAIEAMAAYSPAVITNADCLAEEFLDVAMVNRLPFVPVEYVDSIAQVLENDELYEELIFEGRKFAEGRQWKDIAQRWLDLFEKEKERDR